MFHPVEVLRLGTESHFGLAVLEALPTAIGEIAVESSVYQASSPWLLLYGVGEPTKAAARKGQLKRGWNVGMFDLGYFGKTDDPMTNHGRVSLNDLHPHRCMGVTPADPARWLSHGISLREDWDPQGPIIVIGMGQKSRAQLKLVDWEYSKLREMQRRFPKRKILYRPKRTEHELFWPHTSNPDTPIQEVIRGASLVVCRHSNVGVDCCIAGIPVETEDGAALWLYSRHPKPTVDQRLDFLYRLAHWQYQVGEMNQAWRFLNLINRRMKKLHEAQHRMRRSKD